jgi:hypothetical protein
LAALIPKVVCVLVPFAPLVATFSAVLVFEAAAVPDAAIETRFPDVVVDPAIANPLPVVLVGANEALIPLRVPATFRVPAP